MDNENPIVTTDNSLVPTIARVKEQVQLIQHVMKEVMIEDEHYGIIPGCKKKSLLKPGAEKLLLTFRFAASYKEVSVIEKDDFISYRMQCDLTHITSGNYMGSGMGTCNSRENKYSTRSVSVSKATTQERETALRTETRYYYDKRGNKKEFEVYIINQNPWDLQNTFYKMACKRALIAAILNATAASDIFTQDIDENFVADNPEKPKADPPKRKSETNGEKRLAGIHVDYEDEKKREVVKAVGFKWNKELALWTKDVNKDEFDKLSDNFEIQEIP